MGTSYAFERFGDDPDTWNVGEDGEGDGNPGMRLAGRAIQFWSACQDGDTTVGAAAAAFRMPPRLVAEAVHAHPWMFLVTPDRILPKEAENLLGETVAAPLPDGLDYAALVIEHEGE
ncbi:hypothetical protein [Azospirillum sp.]|uniref:hypothetical protein n=1 Tax=Azospirillum sp. TaxID=34012 RepID=UPI003D7080A4